MDDDDVTLPYTSFADETRNSYAPAAVPTLVSTATGNGSPSAARASVGNLVVGLGFAAHSIALWTRPSFWTGARNESNCGRSVITDVPAATISVNWPQSFANGYSNRSVRDRRLQPTESRCGGTTFLEAMEGNRFPPIGCTERSGFPSNGITENGRIGR